MDRNDLFYGMEHWEYLEPDPDEAFEYVLDNACDNPWEESFDDVEGRIDWPVRINVYKRMEIGDATVRSIAERCLDESLRRLDEEYGNPDGDFTEPTDAMKAAALEFGKTVVREYVPWACEKTGTVIEYSREYARKVF